MSPAAGDTGLRRLTDGENALHRPFPSPSRPHARLSAHAQELPMHSRRVFIRQFGAAGSTLAAALTTDGLAQIARASARGNGRSAADLAADEDFRREIQ